MNRNNVRYIVLLLVITVEKMKGSIASSTCSASTGKGSPEASQRDFKITS